MPTMDPTIDPGLAGDRIVIRLDAGQPVELTNLSGSLSALGRIYERHHRRGDEDAPKLYVTRLTTGSIVAEITPYAVMFGGLVLQSVNHSLAVAEFTKRLVNGIKAFSGLDDHAEDTKAPEITNEDAADIREFVRPLTGKRGAQLGIKLARMEKTHGEARTLIEYEFDETAINRAAINIDQALVEPSFTMLTEAPEALAAPTSQTLKEVMLFVDQANRSPGKERGRTADKGIVPDVSPKALPVYFRKGIQDLKDKMIRGEINPLKDNAFVVDAHVQYLDGEPKAYLVTDVHQVISTGDEP